MSKTCLKKTAFKTSKRRKPKGKYVCDWCYTKFPTQIEMGWTQLGKVKLCTPCGKLHVDSVLKRGSTDPTILEDMGKRIEKCPGLLKEMDKLLKEKEDNNHGGFSLTIIKKL